ncbi:MAG: CBASS cGAMP-activated phospholipase [Pseudomonadota bacterium]|nr:CBASS cGAMP-activated phospholipase [Pseudomonadota bacterium]
MVQTTTAASTDSARSDRFQILALSGGGFRGLFTAKILADIEQHIGSPVATRVDLLAGTSIGGILALALAMEIPASDMVRLFERHGAEIFSRRRLTLLGTLKSTYTAERLRDLLQQDELFGGRLLSACKHRVIVPSINYSTGKPVIFKTSHHPNFVGDHRLRLVDIALATSAAPMYFPRHVFENSQYVDGGLYANAPGLLALHEAEKFLGQRADNVWAVSIGTMSSRFTVNPSRNRSGGTWDWGGWSPANAPKRLFGLAISIQESTTQFMLSHRLDQRYIHVDETLTDEKAKAVALDKTDAAAREALLGSASEASKTCLGNPDFRRYLQHAAPVPQFFHTEKSPQ